VTSRTPSSTDPAAAVRHFADLLVVPTSPPPDEPWTAQSLAKGAAGIALLHIERAHTGHGTWRQAHAWIRAATAGDISAADNTGLFLGAPAVAFLLHAANVGHVTRYGDALTVLDHHVTELAHRRVTAATARIHRGELPTFREYDTFLGLTGIGAHLLRREPGGDALERVLRHLVALTRPLRADGQELPGWWVAHDPHGRPTARYPGGHANLGAAHGITGPLALLSHAMRRGVLVDGHREAIGTICDWLHAWRQESDTGPWWPECVTISELRADATAQPGPARPSWCYGTPGITRAGQLAAIATGDEQRQRDFEDGLARCLTDPAQLGRVTDTGLCHGWAGIYQTAWRAAHDATTPTLSAILPDLAEALAHHAAPGPDCSFLEGDAGTALALHTAAHDAAPTSGWDACLLID
jgi:lantibiotic biosynthesis protein